MVSFMQSTINHTTTYGSHSRNFVFKNILSETLRLKHTKIRFYLLFYVGVKFPHYQTSGSRIPVFNPSHIRLAYVLFNDPKISVRAVSLNLEKCQGFFFTVSYFLKLLRILI